MAMDPLGYTNRRRQKEEELGEKKTGKEKGLQGSRRGTNIGIGPLQKNGSPFFSTFSVVICWNYIGINIPHGVPSYVPARKAVVVMDMSV